MLPVKEVVYAMHITSFLSVDLDLDAGTIPFGYFSCCLDSTHYYNHNLASTDIVIWAGAGCLNKQPDVPGPVLWSSNTGSAMECP